MALELIAQASGTRIYLQGDSIIIKKEPMPNLNTAIFVFALLSFIPIVNGFLLLSHPELGLTGFILLSIGLVMGAILSLLIYQRTKINKALFDDLKTICQINLTSNAVLDEHLSKTGELSDYSLKKSLQFSSSSKKLELVSKEKRILVAKGNPFAGGIEPLSRILEQYFD